MTREQAKQEVYAEMVAVITTLVEQPGQWSPKTPIYLALGSSWVKYEQIIRLLEASSLITCTPNTVHLTAKGNKLALSIAEALNA